MNLLAEMHWAEVSGGLLAGLVLGSLLWRWLVGREKAAVAHQCQATLDAARREAEALVREARLTAAEESARLRREVETGVAGQKREIEGAQGRLIQRETLVNQQLEGLVQREQRQREHESTLERDRTALQLHEREIAALRQEVRHQLEHIAHLSETEARALLMKQVEREALRDATDLSRRRLEEARNSAETEARRIISLAIQRYAGEHTFETTTTTVALNGEDLKGRIIGREGRNIRAFEAATGVTVLIDDTPNAVVLSGFDPVRREVARQSMERLIVDGRIHPTRIEEVVAKVKQEIEETILRAGEEALFRLGLPPMHADLVRLVGRLRFRHSYSQNILDHSIEVAQIAGMMAAELRGNVTLTKRAGLLHDIGKAVNHEVEGSHANIGADLARRYGEPEEVVNGIASHHDEVEHVGLIGHLVSAADAISASRPGARSESMTTYLKRLENLEHIGVSFSGVEKCYAVQAGREVRVLVQPEIITDEEAYSLARNIARRIEDELLYPGQIRVTVVRETRCVEFAK
jgi:ribonuclease Y